MTRRFWRLGAALALGLSSAAAPGCSSSTSPRLNLSVEISDPAGDAPVSAIVPNPPDLVRANVNVNRGLITFEILFGAGWEPATTFLTIDLDVDQDAATGVATAGLGVEYEFGPGGIVRFDGMNTTIVGMPTTESSSNGMHLRAPLELLGNDDGQMNFRVRVSHALQPVFDFLPDVNLPAGRVE
jgi:hypothetical protein